MGKLNVNVGDEVYLKCRVTRIKETPSHDDYYIDVAYPDWFGEFNKEREANVTWSQHLLFTPDGKEA